MEKVQQDNESIKITFNLYELSQIFNALETKFMTDLHDGAVSKHGQYHDLVAKVHRCLGLLKARNKLKDWPAKRAARKRREKVVVPTN